MINPEALKNIAKAQEPQAAAVEGGGDLGKEVEIIQERTGTELVTGPHGDTELVTTEYVVKAPASQSNRFTGLADMPLEAIEIPTKGQVNTQALKDAGLGNAQSSFDMQVVEGTMKLIPALGKHAKPVVPPVHLTSEELAQNGIKDAKGASTSISLGDVSARLKNR